MNGKKALFIGEKGKETAGIQGSKLGLGFRGRFVELEREDEKASGMNYKQNRRCLLLLSFVVYK